MLPLRVFTRTSAFKGAAMDEHARRPAEISFGRAGEGTRRNNAGP